MMFCLALSFGHRATTTDLNKYCEAIK